jgi:hypothetical protein
MEAKHTPGPWELDDVASNQRLGLPALVTAWDDGAGETTDIASISPDDENMWADAALIAAAPDMYVALRMAEQLVARGMAEGAYEHCAAPKIGESGLERISAALAKAEGR